MSCALLHRFNKYMLAPDLGGFPFPLTLTGVHMVFCSVVSWVLVKAKLVEAQDMPVETYTRCAHQHALRNLSTQGCRPVCIVVCVCSTGACFGWCASLTKDI